MVKLSRVICIYKLVIYYYAFSLINIPYSYLPWCHKSQFFICLSIFSSDEYVSFTSSVSLDVGQSDMLAASKSRWCAVDALPWALWGHEWRIWWFVGVVNHFCLLKWLVDFCEHALDKVTVNTKCIMCSRVWKGEP